MKFIAIFTDFAHFFIKFGAIEIGSTYTVWRQETSLATCSVEPGRPGIWYDINDTRPKNPGRHYSTARLIVAVAQERAAVLVT